MHYPRCPPRNLARYLPYPPQPIISSTNQLPCHSRPTPRKVEWCHRHRYPYFNKPRRHLRCSERPGRSTKATGPTSLPRMERCTLMLAAMAPLLLPSPERGAHRPSRPPAEPRTPPSLLAQLPTPTATAPGRSRRTATMLARTRLTRRGGSFTGAGFPADGRGPTRMI